MTEIDEDELVLFQVLADRAEVTEPAYVIPKLAEAVKKLLGEVEQLRYERRLLGACRRHLDEIADPEGRYTTEAIRTAGDLAQRIVDEIGHSVTDEPALGPSFREEIARLTAEVKRLRAPLYSKLVDAYLSGAKPVAEQLMRANEALARHGHDPIECGCELSVEDAPSAGPTIPKEPQP